MNYDLSRFLKAQESDYETALAEIRSGRKRSHWIWYIFPQLKGLGFSTLSYHYGIDDIDEAKAYMKDPVLSARLIEISEALLTLRSSNPGAVMGYPDDLKLRSCMTLFQAANPESRTFQAVLDKFFSGKPDEKTLRILKNQESR